MQLTTAAVMWQHPLSSSLRVPARALSSLEVYAMCKQVMGRPASVSEGSAGSGDKSNPLLSKVASYSTRRTDSLDTG